MKTIGAIHLEQISIKDMELQMDDLIQSLKYLVLTLLVVMDLLQRISKFKVAVAKDLNQLFHAETTIHNNPDNKTLFDSDSHDFSFSKDDVNPNQTKVRANFISI